MDLVATIVFICIFSFLAIGELISAVQKLLKAENAMSRDLVWHETKTALIYLAISAVILFLRLALTHMG